VAAFVMARVSFNFLLDSEGARGSPLEGLWLILNGFSMIL
jgi:hypothetical protein